jgi:putative zinc finger/helix-turn-helix YgiT family protein
MKRSVYCLECRKTVEADVVERSETYTVKSEPYETLARIAVCPQCHQDLFDMELDTDNQRRVFDQYRQKNNLLTPEEIKAIRERYGLSQKAFSRLLGFGEVTIHRYELGSIQEKAQDLIIRQAVDPQFVQRRYEENPGAVNVREKSVFEKRLTDLLQGQTQHPSLPVFPFYSDKDIYTGFVQFHLAKIMNMVLFFASICTDNFFPTKVNKMLWYADMLHYRLSNRSISGSRYLRHQQGPVPEEFKLLYPLMEKEGLIELEYKEIDPEQGIAGQVIHPKSSWNEILFSKSELNVMEFVAERFKKYSSHQISEESLEEEAYRETPEYGFIPYSYAERLRVDISDASLAETTK